MPVASASLSAAIGCYPSSLVYKAIARGRYCEPQRAWERCNTEVYWVHAAAVRRVVDEICKAIIIVGIHDAFGSSGGVIVAVEAQIAARQSLARDDPENERECERGSVCAGSALLMRLVVEPFKSHCCHAAIAAYWHGESRRLRIFMRKLDYKKE